MWINLYSKRLALDRASRFEYKLCHAEFISAPLLLSNRGYLQGVYSKITYTMRCRNKFGMTVSGLLHHQCNILPIAMNGFNP